MEIWAVTDDEALSVASNLTSEETLDTPADRCHPDPPMEVFDRSKHDDEFRHPTDQDVPRPLHSETPEDEDLQCKSVQAEFQAIHCRCGHMLPEKIKVLATRGDLPKRLLGCMVPKCAACMCGEATKRARQSKAPVNSFNMPKPDQPGAVVAMDQLMSSVQGMTGPMKGFITRKQCMVATVFADHFSGLSFVHNQMSTNADHTIEAKRAFE